MMITEFHLTFSEPLLFTTLVRELSEEVSAEWEDIGPFLHVKEGVIESIKSGHFECG